MHRPNTWSPSPALISSPLPLLSRAPRELQRGRWGARPALVLLPSLDGATQEHPPLVKYALKTQGHEQQVPQPLSTFVFSPSD